MNTCGFVIHTLMIQLQKDSYQISFQISKKSMNRKDLFDKPLWFSDVASP